MGGRSSSTRDSIIMGAVEIRHVRAQPTAVIAFGTTWAEWPQAWGPALGEVWEFLRTTDLREGTDGHNVFLYKDDVPNVEVGVQISRAFEPHGRVVPSATPAGRVARMTHRGPYDGLGETHDAIHTWCAENGHTLSRTRWEIYGDWSDDPGKLETEVFWLLR
jgi:effector-binding domain-containing protein